jgi:hypothetical protein
LALREQRPFAEPVAAEPGDHCGEAVNQGRPARRHGGYPWAQSVDAEKQRHDEDDEGDLPDLDPDIEEAEGDEQGQQERNSRDVGLVFPAGSTPR